MKPWVRHAGRTLALSLLLATFQPCQGRAQSKPISDIRFDAPYQQIEPSHGDEWAPTWGRGDVLYTGNDDGTSFGGIPANAIAFGKLEGNGPNNLKGTSINGMQNFREPAQFGPEGARWKTMDSYKRHGKFYRFVPCALDPGRCEYSCLVTSSDDGKAWRPAGDGGKPLFRDTKYSAPRFISYRKEMAALLGGKPDEYVYAASYGGVVGGEDVYIVGRVPKSKLGRGDAADWTFRGSDGLWKNKPSEAGPVPNSMGLGPDGANWKTMNSYSVDGVLYMFVTRCHYPWQSGDPKHRHIFRDSSIIKSTDNGRIWTRTAQENYSKPMFPGKRFGAPYFVWYGKDGAAAVDNAYKYIYAVSNNGHFEAGHDYVLGRVLRTKLPDLSAADWSFYSGGDGLKDGSWATNLAAATPLLTEPGHCSMTGMTYVEGLRRYVMVGWHYSQVGFETAILKKDLSTILEFYEAPKPWGPWTKVKSFYTGRLGWYTPIVGQRFQVAVNPTTVTAFLYATGLASNAEGRTDSARYKLNYMPITLSTQPLHQKDPAFVGGR
ncbi:MAG: hypothetical protein ACRD19_17630 [Terriglobia bacterium]